MAAASVCDPPGYCQYADGACDEDFGGYKSQGGLVLYPSEPVGIASTIERACDIIRQRTNQQWQTWRDLKVAGQTIFCEICRAVRHSGVIVADVTTLNFNLMFEIGYALGLELPVLPIRDTSFIRDASEFAQLGLLDTVGFTDFQNSGGLADAILEALPPRKIPAPPSEINKDSPLYIVKGPIETEGEVRLLSSLKKSWLRFRTYDVLETPRLSLHEVRRQVGSSLGIITHLLSPDRQGATVHNAKCALIAGLAMASGKATLLLQEGDVPQPIDYRDIVVSYEDPGQVPQRIEPVIRRTMDWLQTRTLTIVRPPEGLLQKLDIGDVAAENEIRPLRSYFVETGQYQQAKRGHARLVTGRKGAGKTAIFYGVRDSLGHGKSRVVLDLKPEGHQFTKLREVVLVQLSEGLKEHALTAFWNLIMLLELAHKITEDERSWAQRDPERSDRFSRVEAAYGRCGFAEKGDFSERLLNQVDRVASERSELKGEVTPKQLTEILYGGDIRDLNSAVSDYLDEKEEVWLLIDNLDKSWPTRGATSADILLLRTLLSATRKLQRQLEQREVNFHCLVFLRQDIYEHLVDETPDKGKDTAITLDWSDRELFKAVFRRRVVASGLLKGEFDDLWPTIFDPIVADENSFNYVIERTLLRPRDFLNFIHRGIEVAINRGHGKVSGDDMVQAEKYYSEDLLQATAFELRDVFPRVSDFLYVFLGCSSELSKSEVRKLLAEASLTTDQIDDAERLLVWFGFLGVKDASSSTTQFAYDMRYDMTKATAPIRLNRGCYVVHPGFRTALECEG